MADSFEAKYHKPATESKPENSFVFLVTSDGCGFARRLPPLSGFHCRSPVPAQKKMVMTFSLLLLLHS